MMKYEYFLIEMLLTAQLQTRESQYILLIMLEITYLFYYTISFGCLFVCYFNLRNRWNFYQQSYIFLIGLLGLYVCLNNGWHHGHWILYTLICLVLTCILFFEHASEKPSSGYIFLWSFILFILEETLFFIDSELYQTELSYARRILTILLTYTFTKFIVEGQFNYQTHDKQTRRNILKFYQRCFMLIAIFILTYINGLWTSFTDVITFLPAVLWAHTSHSHYTESQLAEIDTKNKIIREILDKNKQSCNVLKEKEAITEKNQQSIAELTQIGNQLLAKNENSQSQVKQLMNSINEKNDVLRVKRSKIQAQEQRIKVLLKNDNNLKEQIQKLKDLICSREQKSLQKAQENSAAPEENVENLQVCLSDHDDSIEHLHE